MINRLLLGMLLLTTACNSKKEKSSEVAKTNQPQVIIADTATNFFPVTSYLRGEIFGIKNGGITPLKKTTVGKKTDSIWIQLNEFETEFASFLYPVIDTANLKNIFNEKKFLDQTLNAFTFTYDPSNSTADTFAFKHWDVYVDPESNKVTRIYLAKTVDAQTELKLFWQSGKWCKIITVKNAAIVKEEKISWSYVE